jgi:hypothetical protein
MKTAEDFSSSTLTLNCIWMDTYNNSKSTVTAHRARNRLRRRHFEGASTSFSFSFTILSQPSAWNVQARGTFLHEAQRLKSFLTLNGSTSTPQSETVIPCPYAPPIAAVLKCLDGLGCIGKIDRNQRHPPPRKRLPRITPRTNGNTTGGSFCRLISHCLLFTAVVGVTVCDIFSQMGQSQWRNPIRRVSF